jgi:hypothetical protein
MQKTDLDQKEKIHAILMTMPEGEVVHQTTLRLSSSADECYALRNVANDGRPNLDGLESGHKYVGGKSKTGLAFLASSIAASQCRKCARTSALLASA